MRRAAPVLLAAAFVAASFGAPGAGAVQEPDPGAAAEALFVTHCASCHGPDGAGTARGPSLVGVGEASADFQLRTGRMPLPYPGAPTVRKPPAFDSEEIAQLVTYVGQLGVGPEIPEVDLDGADLQRGARLFIDDCAACHGATANGGAVGGAAFAPTLRQASALDVAEAMITGPGEMPKFAFDEDDRNAVARYVAYLEHAEPVGGMDIGGIGPVSEGYVAWALAMVILIVIVAVIVPGPRGKARRRVFDGDEG